MCIKRFLQSAEVKPHDIVDSFKDANISTLCTVNRRTHVKLVYSALHRSRSARSRSTSRPGAHQHHVIAGRPAPGRQHARSRWGDLALRLIQPPPTWGSGERSGRPSEQSAEPQHGWKRSWVPSSASFTRATLPRWTQGWKSLKMKLQIVFTVPSGTNGSASGGLMHLCASAGRSYSSHHEPLQHFI